ncbi:right-handed parallel beta-helix repeat-containing protein [Mariniflexile sp. AS56]|uniref:right-handed parallel beta-helix repeat-containing protein n=1 Tax=Mariniflexile sp. AS56 TaxID=3063957 RepID=UPI0026EEF64D|nr:right-handed parallel beta-helix repeat-containing protein [Mariniflexile sp. AS56]MDO7172516.1 right-handed parallel beta-helix repeat-containing protein [Mariniflexile sp. AS56]
MNRITRIIRLLCVLTMLSGCVQEESVINVFISPSGSNINNGSKEAPFATLERARDEVRKYIKEGLKNNVSINLRAGEYTLSETLVLGLEDFAPNGFTITYQNYNNEDVTISSGVHINNWKKVNTKILGLPKAAEGKVWEAKVPSVLKKFYTLYKGDERLPRARTEGFVPDTDIHPRDNPDPNLDKYTLHYPEGALRNWDNLSDVELFIIPGYPWWMNILPLASVEEEKRIAKTAIIGTQKLVDMVSYSRGKEGYEKTTWIENVPEGMLKPGNWMLNTKEGKVYLWEENGKPNNNIFAPALRELIKVEGKNDEWGENDIPVQGIIFKGLSFTKADRGVWEKGDKGIQHDWEMLDKDNAMLRFRGAKDCKVEQCHFFNAGGNAIRMDLYAQNISVENCLFNNLGQSAVMMLGYGLGKEDVNKNNRVYNNHIHDCGQIYWHSQMITAWQSGDNYIGHNYLHDIPRKAICISGIRFHFLSEEEKDRRECVSSIRWKEIGSPQSFEEMIPFLHSRNNIIEYNDIHHALEMLGDGAAINLSGGALGNIVRYNYVHDITALNPSSAIRTDNDQNETLIENNIIYNISVAGISPKGKNTVRNNFIINACARKNYGIYRGMGQHQGGLSNIEHNIVYNAFENSDFYSYYKFDDYNEAVYKTKTIDYNLYYNPLRPESNWEGLSVLKSKGFDAHSKYEDPMFEDFENGNFTLKHNSPALKMGIKQIEISGVGLTDVFPQKWKN